MSKLSDRLQRLKDNIRSACEHSRRDPNGVKLVIVTKSASFESIKEIIKLGHTELGESHVQQFKNIASQVADFLGQGDSPSLPSKVNWHMIGHLQRNKVKQVLGIASLIHSVDTLRLAEEINTSAAKMGLCPDILLQVNSSEEPQKYGVQIGAAIHLTEQIATMPNLRLSGLMTIAPLTQNKDTVRACFARVRELFDEIRSEKIAGRQFSELSMGMSSDYQTAVQEGATILRIGSSVFSD